MGRGWRPPVTPTELEKFVDLIVEGNYALEPPARLLFCTSLIKADVEKELKQAEENSARIHLISPHFPYARLRKMLRRIDTVLLKNEAILHILEFRGDKFDVGGEVDKAFRCYSLALSFAPTGSPAVVKTYMKRASILMKLEKYELALKDIHVALLLDKPFQLFEQKVICEALIVPKVKEEEDLKREKYKDKIISQVQGHDHLPSVIPDSISVGFHPYKGRFLVTNVALEPGTTVIVEDPFVALPAGTLKWKGTHCQRCLRETVNPIPCEGCVFYTYCDEKCRSDDLNHGGHKYECPLVPYAHCMKLYQSELLALKTVCKEGPYVLKELFDKSKYVHQIEDTWYVPADATHGNSDPYSQVLNMATHDRSSDMPHSGVLAASLAYALRVKTTFYDQIEESETLDFEKFIATVLLHHFDTFAYNTMGLGPSGIEISDIETYFQNVDGSRTCLIGSAVYPVVNLLNHACAPTVFRIHLPGGRIAIITNRYLKAGEEFTLSYGYEYLKSPLNERRSRLKTYFWIKCDCIACIENWPMLKDMDMGEMYKFVCQTCKSRILNLLSQTPVTEIVDEVSKREGCTFNSESDVCDSFSVILAEANRLVLNNQPLQTIPLTIECIKHFQCDQIQPSLQLIKAQLVLVGAYELIVNTINDKGTEDITSDEEELKTGPVTKEKSCSIT